ncbi:hypothetical protein DID77_04440 [Candidatus Marinamargulisbacteria bacterium SCGC AG-439-L15]|nr:hypothetical protein DID77_04440 [Candidatus Marinamargulisbacteria bacterium SCGC AG-439-L15]
MSQEKKQLAILNEANLLIKNQDIFKAKLLLDEHQNLLDTFPGIETIHKQLNTVLIQSSDHQKIVRALHQEPTNTLRFFTLLSIYIEQEQVQLLIDLLNFMSNHKTFQKKWTFLYQFIIGWQHWEKGALDHAYSNFIQALNVSKDTEYAYSYVLMSQLFLMTLFSPKRTSLQTPTDSNSQKDMTDSIIPIKAFDDNIYFIWTTSAKSFDSFHLACIESIVRHYKEKNIYILSNTLRKKELRGLSDNVQIIPYKLSTLLKGTPLLDWYLRHRSQLSKNPFWFAEQADIIRYVVLYKYGGMYFDTDIFLIKPLRASAINALAYQDKKNEIQMIPVLNKKGRTLNIAQLCFSKKNAFLKACLKAIPSAYNPKQWGCLGPLLVTQEYFKQTYKRETVKIVPYYFFYPITNTMGLNYLFPMDSEEKQFLEETLKKSYAIHLYSSALKDSKRGLGAKTTLVTDKDSFLYTLFKRVGLHHHFNTMEDALKKICKQPKQT